MPKTKAFIEKARAKHGDRYDYSKVDYVRANQKVDISCKDHGFFQQVAAYHLSGNGCPRCGREKTGTANRSSKKDFISKALLKHGDTYDYSKVMYVTSKDKVEIICHKHGSFWQEPSSHNSGHGCPWCGECGRPDTQIWIERSVLIHGDRYDYSKAKYETAFGLVEIGCKAHGFFKQTARDHASGKGCQECAVAQRGVSNRSSTTEFVERATAVHGDRYDYTDSNYITSSDAVEIKCMDHGSFWQNPWSHLLGSGCSKCSGRYSPTTSEWVERAVSVHGDTYDYSATSYAKSSDSVDIICKEHGVFAQIASDHLAGKGCRKCAGVYPPTTAEWVERAVSTHGDRYDYSDVIYTRTHDKVIIRCIEHGIFEQSAVQHLSGRGCPRCLWDRDQSTAIYLMQMGAQVKIGISIDPDARLDKLNRNNPKPAHIVTTWTLEDFPTAHAMEQRIHRKLKLYHANLSGFDGASEWFNTTPEHAEQVVKKLLFATMPNSATITNKATQMDLFT